MMRAWAGFRPASPLRTPGRMRPRPRLPGQRTARCTGKRVCTAPPVGHAACDARVVTDANLTPRATTTYSAGYSPTQLQAAYGLTGMTAGTTVAIVDANANPNAAADLAVYRNQFGLGTAALTQVNQSGGKISAIHGNVGRGQEEMLDLEMVLAICPNCSVLYVGARSASFADLATAVDTAASLGARVISNSYGGGEFSTEAGIASHYNHAGVATPSAQATVATASRYR